jgi:hypothetical protein
VTWLAPLFGALYGTAELVPRYRDAPLRALATWSAFVYLCINAAASLGALVLIRAFDWSFGLEHGPALNLVRVLVAGFGAMALFRSSLFITKIGNDDVAVGPVTVLQAGLSACDRGVDRKRAMARARDVRAVMADVTLDQAIVELPQLAFNLMQNVTDVEKAQLAVEAAEIASSDFRERTKVYVLGLALMNLTGKDALEAAVGLLREGATGPGGGAAPQAVAGGGT